MMKSLPYDVSAMRLLLSGVMGLFTVTSMVALGLGMLGDKCLVVSIVMELVTVVTPGASHTVGAGSGGGVPAAAGWAVEPRLERYMQVV